MSKKTFSFQERAKQKELSRARDQARLEAGEITAAELQKENAFFKGAGFANKKIGFSPKCRPQNGDRYYRVEPDGNKDTSKAKINKLKNLE